MKKLKGLVVCLMLVTAFGMVGSASGGVYDWGDGKCRDQDGFEWDCRQRRQECWNVTYNYYEDGVSEPIGTNTEYGVEATNKYEAGERVLLKCVEDHGRGNCKLTGLESCD